MKKIFWAFAILTIVGVTSCNDSKKSDDETKAIEQAQEQAADSSLSKGLDQLNQELNDSAKKDTSAKRV